MFLTEEGGKLIIKDESGKEIARHMIPSGEGNIVINKNHRRNMSVKVSQLREQLRKFFFHSDNINTFIAGIEKKYPRYVRDQGERPQ